MTNLTEIIVNLNIIFWIFPAVRQYKGGYFYYFFVLGISGLLISILYTVFRVHPMYPALICSYFALLAIIYYKIKINYAHLIFFTLPLIFFLASSDNARIGVFVYHGFIFYYAMTMLAKDMAISDSINFYFIIILLYESSLLLKVSARLVNVESGTYFFYITTAFQILIAIYFTFYNLKNSPKIKFKTELT